MRSLPSARALRLSTALLCPSLAVLGPLLAPPAAAQTAPASILPTVVVRPPATDAGGQTGGEGTALTPDTATISGAEAAAATLFTSDSGALIGGIPGGAAWGAGGVSSLPAVNGMGADRVQVAINGMIFSPACPNEMNPPMSFVNPAMISTTKVYYGTAPVSVGGDYTGAKVDVTVAPARFTPGNQLQVSGSVSGFYRSNGNAYGVDANATVSNADTSVTYTGGWARASDYTSGNGTTIKSTMYETQNHALSISKKLADNIFTLQVGGQFIPSEGFVNQYMDMVENKSIFVNGRYEGMFDWGKLEATTFFNRVRHTMGFIAPDKDGDMPMDTRSTDLGYTVKATVGLSPDTLMRIGNEVFYNNLDDWWPPVDGSMMMGPDTFENINNGQRLRVGTYAEWEKELTDKWTTVIGLRNDIVWMNTGDVQGYNEMMYGLDAALFNAQSHARTDINFDGTVSLRYEPDAASLYELGLARKTRSPNLYERYAWSTSAMAMKMIGWYGDGNGYVGNLDLEPEAAHTASFTATWHDPAQQVWQLKVSPYYSYVVNYIDADRCTLAGCLSNLPSNLITTDNFVYLQFANHDAWLYGVNIDGKLALWNSDTYGQGTFRGSLNFVQGQRTDGVNLYHMMPVNSTLAVDNTLGNWTTSLELQLVGSKVLVNQVRNELETSSYALLNFRTAYEWQMVRVDFGIENIFDTEYDLPLGGANLVNYQVPSMMGSSTAWGYPVAGMGRSINTRVTVKF
ncbi:TonB-dependent receptor [Xanthobacter agilis]|uniref:Iron complex outermembrane receptor protein n=1 Tax=Xanthobacter agilis TaxID=47492 RepID=A0ABU0L907_XANAG|nr:TonB-dependent receptor plug domain-containing protein [Xanthobacter agilis]MDQ0503633.1 iron complex outermembrane receptor protein [Xanthobacter agilis]